MIMLTKVPTLIRASRLMLRGDSIKRAAHLLSPCERRDKQKEF
jgi:hypothetical protein